jgi:hypothetical protein
MKTKNHVEPNKIFSIFGRVSIVLPFKITQMKKLFLILIPGFLLLTASTCNEEESKDTAAEIAQDTAQPAKLVDCEDNILCKYCCSTDNHKIRFDSVRILIRNYQQSYGAAGLNAGAVFGDDEIKLSTNKFLEDNQSLSSVSSTAFYPAMETINSKNYFYLSTQPRLCKDTNPEPACSTSVEFRADDQVYRSDPKTSFSIFSNQDFSTASLQSAILSQRTNPANCIQDNNLLLTSSNFRNKYGYIHESPAMIYQKGITIMELLSFAPRKGRTNEGIRYYFGLDFSNSKHPLRVILCAVDNMGEIIVPNNDWDQAFRESSRPRRP